MTGIRQIVRVPIVVLSMVWLAGCGGSSDQETQGNDTGADPFEPTQEPYFGYQWYLSSRNTTLRQYGYAIDPQADINITDAWGLTRGGGITVAVIDDGADTTHPEIADAVIDTYDALDRSSQVYSPFSGETHGLHVAGIIAAKADRQGIVGIAPDAKLIIIRLTDASDATVIHALEYARTRGARVINCSWGTYNLSDAVDMELQNLYEAGVTVVFATGNEGISLDDATIQDESESPWVIGVGASDEANDVAIYSNYGQAMDIIAPGGNMWNSAGVVTTDDLGDRGSDDQLGLVTDDYAFVAGSSFSAPMVSAVAALMLSVNPSLTPQQVREILIQTADKVGGIDAAYDADGFDLYRAYGKLNAGKAVDQAYRLR